MNNHHEVVSLDKGVVVSLWTREEASNFAPELDALSGPMFKWQITTANVFRLPDGDFMDASMTTVRARTEEGAIHKAYQAVKRNWYRVVSLEELDA